MSSDLKVVIVGAGPAAESVLESMGAVDWGPAAVELLAAAPAPGAALSYRQRSVGVHAVSEFDFSSADLALFLDEAETAAEFAELAAAAGCMVVEATGALSQRTDVPQVVAGLDPEGSLGSALERGIVSVPIAPAALLVRLLVPLHALAGVESVHATALRSMGGFGSAAVEELAAQTAALLNAQEREYKVFDAPIAFNLLPEAGDEGGGHAAAELGMMESVRRFLTRETLPVEASSIRVPVFHGDGLDLHVTLTEAVDPEAVAAALRQAGLAAAGGPLGPDPRTAAAGEGIQVGRIRVSGDDPRRLALWAVVDPVRCLTAASALSITALLVQELG